ncbi:MAG TPA: cyclophane-forming radical SAM/SPASM peptide maturase GrrM/OscB [Acidobacteriaceae bacterium]|jgi:uncharacterized protein
MPRAETRIHTIVLQPTPFCNIQCKYCYLPTRNDKSVMSLETVVATLEKVFASPYAGPQITVIWHAGEPLVLPVSYYQAAFEAIERMRPASIQIRHSIQTNGTLVTNEWADLIRRWNVGVGVSIDGPQQMHDANRVTRAGKGTFDRAIRGARLLKKEGIPFHVISVLSKEALDRPEELHAFYLEEGIEDVCFNVEESEGDHVSELMTLSRETMRLKFQDFLHRFWRISRSNPGISFIREIDGLISRIFRPEDAEMSNEQVEPLAMLNVDCRGNVSTFSPELLGYKNDRYNDFLVGNVHYDTLEQMLESPAMTAMVADINAGVEACRKECGYFSICGGGAPVNKLSENGSFASTQTSFCSLVQITPADLILTAFDHMETSLMTGPRDAPAEQPIPFVGQASSVPSNAFAACA